LYGIACWNSKDAIPISLPFSVVLCFLFMARLKAAAFYPFSLNVFLKRQIPSIKHSLTYCLGMINECSQHWMFLWWMMAWFCMEVEVCMSGLSVYWMSQWAICFLVIKTSRNASDPFVSISNVNLIFVCMLLY
jgi:hypothetical protein